MSNRIAEIRKRRGLTQTQLGELLGSARSQIVKLERGERRLTVDWLRRIAQALNVEIAELIGPTESADASPGLSPSRALPHGLEQIPIIAVAQPGHWVEGIELAPEEWGWICLPPNPRYTGMPRFGVRVAGRAWEEPYPDGTILICVRTKDLGPHP